MRVVPGNARIGRLGVLVAAVLGFIGLASPALAVDGCASPIRAVPIFGHLPIANPAPSRDIALFARPYAELPLYVDGEANPPGFTRGIDSVQLFTNDPSATHYAALAGFNAETFIHCSARMVVVVFDNTNPKDPRDLFAGTLRQMIGGWSRLAVQVLDMVAAAYPGYALITVGHSSGGGLASYAAGQRGLPSLVFNPSRTRAADTNPGTEQIVVFVHHDPIADPHELGLRPFRGPRELNGRTLRVEVEVEQPLLELHDMETVIEGLDALIATPR